MNQGAFCYLPVASIRKEYGLLLIIKIISRNQPEYFTCMKIKTKLSLGLGFLFAVILLLAGLGTYYTNRLAQESREILKDNYNSLEFTQNMLQAIDALLPAAKANPAALQTFEVNLQRQINNITETGEQQVTANLKQDFRALQENLATNREPQRFNQNIAAIRQNLFQLNQLNLQAITRKSNSTQKTAERVMTYLVSIGIFSILVTLTFILNFPGYIANPIRELTESIKQIANRNYEQRLHFTSNDEFGELAASFNQMAHQLNEYENSNLAQILFEKKRIETIINNLQDAIIGVDQAGVLLFINTQAEVLLGIPASRIIGQPAAQMAEQNRLLQKFLATGQMPTPLKVTTNGQESYFTKEVLEIHSGGPGEAIIPIGQVIILKNITHFRELDLAKTNFIATISHELKTPIAAIKMSLTLLQDARIGGINPEQNKLLHHIKEDADRLLHITSELLDLAQVETGNIQLHYRPVTPWEIMDYAFLAMQFQAEQKQIKLEIAVPANLPAVDTDLEKTAWVLVNFLSNAIRYSPEAGNITISARHQLATGKPFIQFSVQDFGPGIDPRYKDRIFDKFFRVPTPEAIKGGTGLGLAIAKEFITAQGGSIWVDSKPGAGATFSFTLPVSPNG